MSNTFKPPSKKKRRNAVHEDKVYKKEKITIPDKKSILNIALINFKNWKGFFRSKTLPSFGDWLFSQTNKNEVNGQNFYEWYRRSLTYKLFPTKDTNIIGLISVGEFNISILEYKLFDILSEITSIYYQMDVKLIGSISPENKDITHRIRKGTKLKQLLTTDIHTLLYNIKNKEENIDNNLYCLMCFTMIDLYPRESWNFVFGQAQIPKRTGIFSFARYCHGFDDLILLPQPVWRNNTPKQRVEALTWVRKLLNGKVTKDETVDMIKRLSWSKTKQKIFLKRCIKVLVHELGHLFGMGHCVFFECIMNGSMHLDEADTRPIYFCPVCLHKIIFANLKNGNEIDILKRYKQLNEIYSRFDCNDVAEWYKKRVEFIEKKLNGNLKKYEMIVFYLFRQVCEMDNDMLDNAIVSCVCAFAS